MTSTATALVAMWIVGIVLGSGLTAVFVLVRRFGKTLTLGVSPDRQKGKLEWKPTGKGTVDVSDGNMKGQVPIKNHRLIDLGRGRTCLVYSLDDALPYKFEPASNARKPDGYDLQQARRCIRVKQIQEANGLDWGRLAFFGIVALGMVLLAFGAIAFGFMQRGGM